MIKTKKRYNDEVELNFKNYYHCPKCDEEWIDEWDSMCDDECPSCGLICSPEKSEEI